MTNCVFLAMVSSDYVNCSLSELMALGGILSLERRVNGCNVSEFLLYDTELARYGNLSQPR